MPAQVSDRRARTEEMPRLAVAALTLPILLSLVFDPAGLDPFRAPREALLPVAVIPAAALALALRSLDRRRTIGLGAAIGWLLITTLFSDAEPLRLVAPVIHWLSLILLTGAAMAIATGLQIRSTLLRVMAATAAVHAGVLLLQTAGIYFPLLPTLERHPALPADWIHVAPIGLAGNRNDAAGLIVILALPMAGALASRRVSRFWLLPILVSLAGLAAARTLGALAALATALIAAGFVRWGWRRAMVGVVLLTVAVSGAIAITPGSRAAELRDAVSTGDLDRLLTYRVTAWRRAAHVIADHPLTGAGPGQFARSANAPAPATPPRSAGEEQIFTEAHNDYLQVAAEYGLPALAGLLFLVAASLRRIVRGSPERMLEQLPWLAGVAVLMLVQFPLQLAASGAVIALGLGLIWAEVEVNE